MVLNRPRHTDSRHRGDAGRNTAGGLAGLDENAELTAATLPASVRQNIALGMFEISMLKVESMHSMLDGVRDVFNDAAGLLSGNVSSGHVAAPFDLITGGTALANATEGANTAAKGADDTINTYWLGAVSSSGWWQYQFAAGTTIKYYSINMFVGGDVALNYAPKDWTLKGSNTGAFGGEEVTVDTQTGVTWSADGEKVFDCSGNTTAYNYYRLNITDNGGGSRIAINEVRMWTNVDVISVATTAEAQPTNIHAVILADDAAITLNTDLKFYASVDDGATWEQITLEDSGDYSATEIILTGSVAVAGTGTTIKYKIECTDADFEFYAVGLLWD